MSAMKMVPVLFLHFLFLGLFSGHLSFNPESVIVQSPEDTSPQNVMVQNLENTSSESVLVQNPEDTGPENVMVQNPEDIDPESVMVHNPGDTDPESVMVQSPEDIRPEKVMAQSPEDSDLKSVMAQRPGCSNPENMMVQGPENTKPEYEMIKRLDYTDPESEMIKTDYTDPESVVIKNRDKNNNERTAKMQMEDNEQRAFISFDGPYTVIITYMRPVMEGFRRVWTEVYRERIDRGRGLPEEFRTTIQEAWRNAGNYPWISRRTAGGSIIDRETTNKPPIRRNMEKGNNNNPESLRTVTSSPATTKKEEVFLKDEVPKDVVTKFPKKISVDSNFFAGIVNDFAFKLVETLNLESNFVVSPLSIFIALSMCYLGSDGRTKDQMEQVMGMNDNAVHDERLHKGIKDLLSLVMEETSSYELFVANGMFLAKNFTPNVDFLKDINNYYYTEPKTLDFENPELSLQSINLWVTANTKNMITNIITSPPSTLTRLVLLNAIFFKGIWKMQFPAHLTHDAKFYPLNGREKEVPTMRLFEATLPIFRSDEHRHSFIKLPYVGDQLSMIIALPDEMGEKPMPSVTDEILCRVRDAMVETNLRRVTIPKFRLEYKKSLVNLLRQLGITDIFDINKADFSKLRKEKDLHVSSIIHKAVVEVNEVGTLASASTSDNFVGLSYKNNTNFEANHPFAFYIVHEPTGLVLFYGKVFDLGTEGSGSVDPRESVQAKPRPNSQNHG